MAIAWQESIGGTSRQRENFEKKAELPARCGGSRMGKTGDEVTSHMKEYRFKNMGLFKL